MNPFSFKIECGDDTQYLFDPNDFFLEPSFAIPLSLLVLLPQPRGQIQTTSTTRFRPKLLRTIQTTIK